MSEINGSDLERMERVAADAVAPYLDDEIAKDLDTLLEEWVVLAPGQWDNEKGPEGWYAVANDQGIIAYFGKEADAFRFRLSEINRVLNP